MSINVTVRKGFKKLGRSQRQEVWKLIVDLRKAFADGNLLTVDESLRVAEDYFKKNQADQYDHVLCDEIQDMAQQGLKFVKSIWKDAGEGSITLAGDGHQRLYVGWSTLAKAGYPVKGRRHNRLKINYRTTEEIRMYAHSLLAGVHADDLDGGAASIYGDHSLLHGADPSIMETKDLDSAIDAIYKSISKLLDNDGFNTNEICITAIDSGPLNRIKAKLQDAGLKIFELSPVTEDNPDTPGVRMGPVRRIKGLEFRAIVFLCNKEGHPINNIESASLTERGVVYVACTRAWEKLIVVK